jgi:hypothetical protein
MFLGQVAMVRAKELWKVKASNEYRFYVWLAFQDHCWMSNRLARHDLRNNGPCALCCQERETITHLLLTYVFSREVWFKELTKSGWQQMAPGVDDRLPDWWLHRQKVVAWARRKAFDSLVFLTLRSLWLERNMRVFRKEIFFQAPWLMASGCFVTIGVGQGS